MINCVYYNENIRCYRDGRVERIHKKTSRWGKKGEWKISGITIDNYGYLSIGIDKKTIYIHRLIAYCFLGLENIDGKDMIDMIDHINHNEGDNRVINLRIVTNTKNQWNIKNVKGYSWNARANKWKGSIRVNGLLIHLGYFDTEQEAHAAYLDAKAIHHII